MTHATHATHGSNSLDVNLMALSEYLNKLSETIQNCVFSLWLRLVDIKITNENYGEKKKNQFSSIGNIIESGIYSINYICEILPNVNYVHRQVNINQ